MKNRIVYLFLALTTAPALSLATAFDKDRPTVTEDEETNIRIVKEFASALYGDDLHFFNEHFSQTQKIVAQMRENRLDGSSTLVDKIDRFLALSKEFTKLMRSMTPSSTAKMDISSIGILGLCGKPFYGELDAFMRDIDKELLNFVRAWAGLLETIRKPHGFTIYDEIVPALKMREAITRLRDAFADEGNLKVFLAPYVFTNFSNTVTMLELISSAQWSVGTENLLYYFTQQAQIDTIMHATVDEGRIDEKRLLLERYRVLLGHARAVKRYNGDTLDNLMAIFELFMTFVSAPHLELMAHAQSLPQLAGRPKNNLPSSSTSQRRKQASVRSKTSVPKANVLRQAIAEDLMQSARDIWHSDKTKIAPHLFEKIREPYEECRRLHQTILTSHGFLATTSETPPLLALQHSLAELRSVHETIRRENIAWEREERQKARAAFYARIAEDTTVSFSMGSMTNLRSLYGYEKPVTAIETKDDAERKMPTVAASSSATREKPTYAVNWYATKYALAQYDNLPPEFVEKYYAFVAEIEEDPWSLGLGKAKHLVGVKAISRRFDRGNRFVYEVDAVDETTVNVRILSFLGHYKHVDLTQKPASSMSTPQKNKTPKHKRKYKKPRGKRQAK